MSFYCSKMYNYTSDFSMLTRSSVQNCFLCHFLIVFCKTIFGAVIAAVVKQVKRWRRKRSYWNCSREPIRIRMALCSGVNRLFTLSIQPITSMVSHWHTLVYLTQPSWILAFVSCAKDAQIILPTNHFPPSVSPLFHENFLLSLYTQNVASDLTRVMSLLSFTKSSFCFWDLLE